MAEFERKGKTHSSTPQTTFRAPASVALRVPVAFPPAPVASPLQRLAFTQVNRRPQRAVAAPVFQASATVQRLRAERAPRLAALQRQIGDLRASLPAGAEQAALQRQAAATRPALPAAFQRQASGRGSGLTPGIGDWAGLYTHQMAQHTPDAQGLYPAEPVKALQRAVAGGLAQAARTSKLPTLQRHAELGQALASIQRQPLGRSTVTWSLGQMLPAERPAVQRALDAAGAALQRQADQDAQVEQLHSLQRQLDEEEAQGDQAHLMARIRERQGGGDPLPAAVQRHMEQGLNTDLSGVRIHTDFEAHALSKKAGATAFTTGKDIYFQHGRFDANSRSGLELLGHELTHVKQQQGGQVGRGVDPDAGLEREAQRMGARLAGRPRRAARGVGRLPAAGRGLGRSLQRQAEGDDPQDPDLPPPVYGLAGATGREGFIRAQMEATRMGADYLIKNHRSHDYTSPFIRSGGGASDGIGHLMYGPNAQEGRYNGDFKLLYGSQDVPSNLAEIEQYKSSASLRELNALKNSDPTAYVAEVMRGRNRAEFDFGSRNSGGGGGTVLATDYVDGVPVDHLRQARLSRSAFSAPAGTDGNNNWTKLLHGLAGEHMYTHPQILGRQIYESGASAMLVPSATSKTANQINILPEYTQSEQLNAKSVEYWQWADKKHFTGAVSDIEPVAGVGPREFPRGKAEWEVFTNKGQTQRGGGKRYGAAGAGLMAMYEGIRSGHLDVRDVAGQMALGAATSSQTAARWAERPLGNAVKAAKAASKLLKTGWNKPEVLARFARYKLNTNPMLKNVGQYASGVIKMARAGMNDLAGVRSTQALKNLARDKLGAVFRNPAMKQAGALFGDAKSGIGSFIKDLPKDAAGVKAMFGKTTGALKPSALSGAFKNAKLALPRSAGDFSKMFSKGLGSSGGVGGALRAMKGNAVLSGVVSAGFSLHDNWNDLTKGNTKQKSQAAANVAVDTGVGVASGLAGMAAGAAIGSVIPVAGTAVGAVIGFGAGMLGGWLMNKGLTASGAADWAKKKLGGAFNSAANFMGGKNGAIAKVQRGLGSIKNGLVSGAHGLADLVTGRKKPDLKALASTAKAGMAKVGNLVLGKQGMQVASKMAQLAGSGVGAVAEGAKKTLGSLNNMVSRGVGALFGHKDDKEKKRGGLFGLFG